ncbi:uncharacterized protein [Acropora muricata]|uniref:uncharacterized protein n=1 Tax=Acropora muricata TaxID=159855 RepID=UPI0034E4494D
MAAVYGHVGPFDENTEEFADYAGRYEAFMVANQIAEDRQEALRDRLVSGLHSKMSRTQRHLLAVRELTFVAARDRCIADELANKANKEHMGEPVSEEANKIQDLTQANGRKNTGGRRSNSQRCEACGGKAHGLDVCKFKTATCHRCQRKGHIRPVCKARLPESSFQRRSNNSRDMSVNNCDFNPEEEGDDSSFQMYEDSTVSEVAEGFGLYRTGTDSMTVKPYVVGVQLGNATVNMEVDTGASRSTVSQYVYNTLLSDFPLHNTDVILRSYSGEKLPILGKISVPVKYSSNDEKVLDLVVVQDLVVVLD